jgi:hypothetical protein
VQYSQLIAEETTLDLITRTKGLFLLMYVDPRFFGVLRIVDEALKVPKFKAITVEWLSKAEKASWFECERLM